MQTIRTHHRSRRRIILTDFVSLLGCWLLAFVVVVASQYDNVTTWICSVLAIACTIFYAWTIIVACRHKTDFELVLTTSRISCHSPDQRICPNFDVELKDITEVITDSEGWSNLVTSTGEEIKLSLTRNFGAPVKLFAQDIASQLPQARS
jgi:hypothetical protein